MTRTDDTIRWGILATGGIAGAFARDLATLPEGETVAVGSRSPESARRFADAHGIPRAYGSWTELAADPDVDVVYVATPHSAHFEAARVCLEAGKAVLCEKPLTLNLAQARELVELARRRKVFLMEAMWTYCSPVVRRMLELIDDGAVGEVRSVHADFGIAAPDDPAHRLRDPRLGGGALLDLGVYPVSFAHLVLGAPSSVAAWAHLTPEGVDETTGVLLGYDSGAVATLSCSIAAASPTVAAVSGTRGRIELPHGFFAPETFLLHRAGHEPEEVRVPGARDGAGYAHEAAEVMRCLREKETESPLVPLDGTLAVMTTLDAVRERVGVRYPQD
ncbi:Gfo/Idh/MocA family oxidoreductase [Streptomyces sp. TRM 70361]|uniref:Gfo/Idh/MocA family protein n=1 Tax=Streptomyces sp. TRM 70361 TaxID=3116553 RepID=UPI002E7C15D2|nr:Gfo/Idh/MocA family oxidoreductase [Streptomyces sp. TRM 70361]MEE1941321.1 Gfo/Idh/MocA family oxidoreductase [Streptomyces sp. TRM 70361]